MTNNIQKPGHLFTRALFLVMVGLLSGVLFNALRPAHGIPWYEPWSQSLAMKARQEGFSVLSLEEVRALVADPEGLHLFLDARGSGEYDVDHIPGAVSLPAKEVLQLFPDVQMMLYPDQPLIAYCSGPACEDALALARFMRGQGYTNVVVFIGGMEAWRAGGGL